ncbi:MAG: transposase, partial [Chlamydiae bacterium]|nr:transposase [Chlamydiota bacterium]
MTESLFPEKLLTGAYFVFLNKTRNRMKVEIADVMREIFNSPTLEMALEMKGRAVEKYQKRAPEFAKWLDANVDEGLTIFQFAK